VVPHGFDDYLQSRAAKKADGPIFAHVGNLYGLRSPENFILALGQLKTDGRLSPMLKAEFAGRIKNLPFLRQLVKRLRLDEHVVFRGRVSYKKSLELAAQADVLVLIDAASSGDSLFLPSKLIDYLQFKKPILGITPDSGASADLLRKMGQPVVDPQNVAAIAEGVFSLQEQNRNAGTSTSAQFEEGAKEYNIKTTTNALEAVLKKIGR
jgi:glycosyltransferase involved in cell wall biosynthesis